MSFQSVHDETVWTETTNIPSDATFGTHFNVREETYPKGPRRIIAHTRIITKTKFGDIKYNDGVYNHLKEQKIYIRIDRFEMRKVSSPGFFIDIHPSLTNRNDLQVDLNIKMRNAGIQKLSVTRE